MATRSGRLRRRRRALGRWAVKAALTLRLSFFEAEELGVEGLGVGLLAGDVGQAAAGLGDRGDPRRGSEEDRQEDRGRDFAFGLEVQVRLAEVAGEAVDLGWCQGGSGLAHSSLQKRWNWCKLVWETCLSLPSPATPLTRKFGIY